MERSILESLLRTEPADAFVTEHLLSPQCWYFTSGEPTLSYRDFRHHAAGVFSVEPHAVHIVGSAKLGLSLRPDANFKPFGANSDIDVVIVSRQLFDNFWRNLRKAYYNSQEYVRKEYAKNIFQGFLFFKSSLEVNTTYLLELSKLNDRFRSEVTDRLGVERTVNFRIYADLDDAHAYHVSGITILQRSLTGI